MPQMGEPDACRAAQMTAERTTTASLFDVTRRRSQKIGTMISVSSAGARITIKKNPAAGGRLGSQRMAEECRDPVDHNRQEDVGHDLKRPHSEDVNGRRRSRREEQAENLPPDVPRAPARQLEIRSRLTPSWSLMHLVR